MTKPLFLAALLAAPASAETAFHQLRGSAELAELSAVGGRAVAQQPGLASLPGEGPAAALGFERALRGVENPNAPKHYYYYPKSQHRYPQANPADPASLRNIKMMAPGLALPAELERDFAATKNREQTAILVMVKTEFCHSNQYRVCSVTTAALEKRSTPLLRRFKVYGAWVKGNPRPQGDQRWEQAVIDAYEFEQGPGATLVAWVPGSKRARTDAHEMALDLTAFEAAGGATPRLEAFLRRVLQSAGQTASGPETLASRD